MASPVTTPARPPDRSGPGRPHARPSVRPSGRRSIRALAVVLVLISMTAVACGPGGSGRAGRLKAARSFAFAIGGDTERLDVARLGAYDLVVVDGEGVSKKQVDALHAEGSLVLAYVSVGTIESYRSWYDQASAYKLDLWGDWDEWYADTSKRGFRDLITGTVVPPMLAKGVDGLFLDNVDMISDHEAQGPGMYTLVRALGDLVHADGRLLFAQNGEEIIDPLLGVLDGWNREDVTSTYDFDAERYLRVPDGDHRAAVAALKRMEAAGLVTTATDYTEAASATITREATTNACAAGSLSFVSDIGLIRVPSTPPTCG